VLFHAFPAWLTGGFIGVDVFFVISGYLISRLLFNEVAASRSIDLLAFWQRRIRRILPAATFVLLCCAVLALIMPVLDGRMFGRHVIAAALFYYNVRLASNAVDYLGEPQDDNPLMHYWSLSVEEQFYLAWPLILLMATRLVRGMGDRDLLRLLALTVAGLWTASFVLGAYLVEVAPSWAFFGTASRSWQLLSGAFLALAELSGIRLVRRPAILLSIVAFAVLTASFAIISGRDPYPGALALVPTIAAALLMFANASASTPVGYALANPVVRYVGRISFSLYLWHWPILVFGRHALGDAPLLPLALIALALVLASLTYHFVEQPARYAKLATGSRAAVYSMGLSLIAAGGLTGLALRLAAPDNVHIGGNTYVSAEALRRDRPRIYSDQCLLRFRHVTYSPCIYGAPGARRTVVLFGDSHAGNWFVPLDAAAKSEGWRLLVRVKAACQPIDHVQMLREGGGEREYTECSSWLKSVLAEIDALKPDLIVVAGTRHRFPVEAERRVLERLAAAGRLVIMRDTPWFPVNGVTCLRHHADPRQCEWSMAQVMIPQNYPKTPESRLPPRAQVLDLNDRICPGGVCRAALDGRVVMFDNHHLTASFAGTFTDVFRSLLASMPN